MKKITLIFTLLVSTVMLSSPSYAEWTKLGGPEGSGLYVDYERIRKHGGYVYFWQLIDVLTPVKSEILSSKSYTKGDCKLFRYSNLSHSFHIEPMGLGTGDVREPAKKGWVYPPPNSIMETVLKSVCSR